jgi:hypothetical protein
MRLPLVFTRPSAECTPESGYTRNISSGGVLFATERAPYPGDAIEYVVTLPGGSQRALTVRCMGKVIRCEPRFDAGPPFHVAATMERYEFVRSG